MSKEQLLHIFDDSSCLNRRQMKDYVNGIMTNEESHAIEVHLNACPFCNDAIEGLFEQKEGNTADAVVMLDGDFLKDHLSLHNPQVHLNSLTASQAMPQQQPYKRRRKTKTNTQPFWRNVSIAAVLLLTFGSLWYYKAGNSLSQNRMIAQQATLSQLDEPIETQPNATTQQVVSSTPLGQEEETVSTGNKPVLENLAVAAPSPAAAIPPQVKAIVQNANSITAGKEQKDVTPGESIAANKTTAADMGEPVTATEDMAKLPVHNTQGVTASAPAAYSKQETLSVASRRSDFKLLTTSEAKSKKAEVDNIDKGDELYARQNYAAALKVYSKEISSDDKGRRQKAALMSARCYMGMGNKQKATQLLQNIIDEGGPQKKAAKKLLKDLEESK